MTSKCGMNEVVDEYVKKNVMVKKEPKREIAQQ